MRGDAEAPVASQTTADGAKPVACHRRPQQRLARTRLPRRWRRRRWWQGCKGAPSFDLVGTPRRAGGFGVRTWDRPNGRGELRPARLDADAGWQHCPTRSSSLAGRDRPHLKLRIGQRVMMPRLMSMRDVLMV